MNQSEGIFIGSSQLKIPRYGLVLTAAVALNAMPPLLLDPPQQAEKSPTIEVVQAYLAPPAIAIGHREIPADYAQRGVPLKLSRGYALLINLSTLGSNVSRAWLSDPSQITMSSNQGQCGNGQCSGASIIYLRAIEKLNFPGLPRASDGGSLLSVVTNQGKVLQFKISVDSELPEYTSISLVPEAPKPPPQPFLNTPRPSTVPTPTITPRTSNLPIIPSRPLLQTQQPTTPPDYEINISIPKSASNNSKDETSGGETQPESPKLDDDAVLAAAKPQREVKLSSNQNIALALLRGLHSPKGRAEVGLNSTPYRQVQDIIYLLKKNDEMTLDEAIQQTKIKPSVPEVLIQYGGGEE